MDFAFNDTQEMIRALARDFAREILTDRVEEIEAEENVGHFPPDIYDAMCEAGFLGIAFPEELGGTGAGHDCMTICLEELAKVSPSAATALNISLTPMEAIMLYGTEAQKQAIIPASIAGTDKPAMAFTEPGTGSDPKQLKTVARLEGDTWVINGVKRFISNAQYPGTLLLYALEADTGAVTAFVVDKFCKGYSISTPWDKVGLKGSAVYDIFLDDVEVPNDAMHILGKRGDGFAILKGVTGFGKLGFSSVFLGTLAGALDRARDYITTKTHRDGVITKFQAVQMKFASLLGVYESCRYMVYRAAQLADSPEDPAFVPYSALVKAHVGDQALQGCILAMNLMGSYGVMQEYRVENFLRDALIGPHVEGQTDVQRVIAAGYFATQTLD